MPTMLSETSLLETIDSLPRGDIGETEGHFNKIMIDNIRTD